MILVQDFSIEGKVQSIDHIAVQRGKYRVQTIVPLAGDIEAIFRALWFRPQGQRTVFWALWYRPQGQRTIFLCCGLDQRARGRFFGCCGLDHRTKGRFFGCCGLDQRSKGRFFGCYGLVQRAIIISRRQYQRSPERAMQYPQNTRHVIPIQP